MQTSNLTNSSLHAIEDALTDAFRSCEGACRKQWVHVEEKIRESPTKAVLIAAGIGYVLHRLPMRSLLATQLKLLWALAPPAVMAVAAGKGLLALEEKLHSEKGASTGTKQRPKSVAQATL